MQCGARIWRAYLKNEPGTVKLLQAQVRPNTVHEALKGVNMAVPNINAEKLDPVSNPNYKKAYLTMLILIKDALVAAADAHNTPQHLRNCWVDSFPCGGSCDDVDLIISRQLSAYNSLVARTGKHVSDEERVNRVRHCFSPAFRDEFNDHLARARIDASCMDWATCLDIAHRSGRVPLSSDPFQCHAISRPTSAFSEFYFDSICLLVLCLWGDIFWSRGAAWWSPDRGAVIVAPSPAGCHASPRCHSTSARSGSMYS